MNRPGQRIASAFPLAQVTIGSRRRHLEGRQRAISEAIHACATEALGRPAERRIHRPAALEAEDFIHPPDRGERYTILEFSQCAGRSAGTKWRPIRLPFERCACDPGIVPQALEITRPESAKANGGIRGKPGDELALG